MAKVQVQVAGGSIQHKTVGTVGELKRAMDADNHVAMVNGETVSDSKVLIDYEFVSLAPKVKAG